MTVHIRCWTAHVRTMHAVMRWHHDSDANLACPCRVVPWLTCARHGSQRCTWSGSGYCTTRITLAMPRRLHNSSLAKPEQLSRVTGHFLCHPQRGSPPLEPVWWALRGWGRCLQDHRGPLRASWRRWLCEGSCGCETGKIYINNGCIWCMCLNEINREEKRFGSFAGLRRGCTLLST